MHLLPLSASLGVLSCLCAAGALAQGPTQPARSYAEESVVVERSDTSYTFAADGMGVREQSLTVRIQSEAALRALGVVSIPYAGNSENVEFLYARVHRPDGSVMNTSTEDALEMPVEVTRQAPFYSDLKEKQLPVRSLRVGDTLEWKVRVTRTKAEAPGQFWGQESFSQDVVALDETMELYVPAGMYVNVWSKKAKPVESTEGSQHVYRWSSKQLEATAGKEAEAAKEAKKKQVWTAEQEKDDEEGKLPDVAWTTFKSWEDVGAWYRGLLATRVVPDAEVQAKAAELTKGKTGDEEKVKALYSYVATQIRYIGVALGVGRYQPHAAADILSNQYGDCKDKHTLLASLLAASGIQSDAVLIGAGIRFNPDVPSPSAFNHLITHLTVNGQPVWLDTTAEVGPYRVLLYILRDHQALVVPPEDAARVEKTPADLPFATEQTWDAKGSLDAQGVSHSRLTITLRGDDEIAVRAAFRQVAPAQYDELVQKLVANMGYEGKSSNSEVSRPEDTAAPFKISFDYEREKAGDWDNHQIIPQLAPVELGKIDEKEPMVRSLLLGMARRVSISHSEMKIPDGWGAVLPEAVHAKSAYATYDESYRFEKGTVYSERRIEVLKRRVPVEGLKEYAKWAKDADLGNELYIRLRPNGAAVADVGAAGDSPMDALVEQARKAIVKKDFKQAQQFLDRAEKLSPDEENMWLLQGSLVMIVRGKKEDALADFEKELKYHPENFKRIYPILVRVQVEMGLKKDAEETLRTWMAKDPSESGAVTQLMGMLLEDGDAAGAMAAGESAMPHIADPKATPFLIELGKVQVKAGSTDKGKATLEAVLKDAQTPLAINNVAYVMGDLSVDLPEVEASARGALEKLSAISSSWTLDEDPAQMRLTSNSIVATWDTLGWILFREGKYDEAASYLKAAWFAQESAEERGHMEQLAEARKTKPELDIVRRFPAGASDGRSGVGEYRLLIQKGKIIKVKSSDNKPLAKAEEAFTKASFPDATPAGSQTVVMRTGFLNCHQNVCEVVLEQ